MAALPLQRQVSAAELALEEEKSANIIDDTSSCLSESCDELKLSEKYELVGQVYANGKVTNLPFKRSCFLDREACTLRIVRAKGEPKDTIQLGKVKTVTRTEKGFDLLGEKGKLYRIKANPQEAEHWYKEVRAVRLVAVQRDEVERQKDPYWRAKLAASERSRGKARGGDNPWQNMVQKVLMKK